MKRTLRMNQWDDLEDEDTLNNPVEESPFDPFYENGWIVEVLETLKSGKEATVYRCKAHSLKEVEFFALKLYRDRQNRNFKNDTVYQEGRVILDSHTRRAVQKKTNYGRQAQAGIWIGYEYEHLKLLHKLGADVPKPYVLDGKALLLEYIGDAEGAAPTLGGVKLEATEVRPLFELVMRNIELWLKHNLIHADLSPFNILYWDGTLKVIDFPQAVDPRFNPNAFTLLLRDIDNICRYFNRYGLQADATRLAENLWRRFMRSQL